MADNSQLVGMTEELHDVRLNVNGATLRVGDGAAASEEASLTVSASEDAEIMLFDLA